MFVKLLLITFLMTSTSYAAHLGGIATKAQLESSCIPLQLDIDNQIHWFYIKNVYRFDDSGVEIRSGKWMERKSFYSKDEILNFEQARSKYKRLKGVNHA